MHASKDLHADALGLLKELVRNACVNDLTANSGQEVRNANTLERFFHAEIQAGLIRATRFEPHPGRVSIAFTLPANAPEAPLTFLGHTDVVPIDPAKWTRPAFDAHIEDGKIYGRGTIDMLFITAAMATALRQLARISDAANPPAPAPRHGEVTFVALADEEARGGLGAKWLRDHAPDAFSWENCVSETGGAHIHGQDGHDSVTITVGEKGAAQRRLHVHGSAGHGSAPYGKDSAVVKIGEVARRLAHAAPEVTQDPIWGGFVGAFRFDPDTEAALLRGEGYEHLGELAGYGHAVSHLTIAQTVLRAGKAINVLPSHAYLECDIRTLPGQSDEDVDALITAALGELAGEVEIEHLISEPASVSPTDHRLYRAIEATLRDAFPNSTAVPILSSGGSDLRFARRAGGVGYGFAIHAPSRTLGEVFSQLHAHDEHLYLEDFELTVQGYLALLRNFYA
ncbi:M20/M25/M40 family metallo-hydrolase [Corynebacterium sp. 153RC1]|uniref:M20/M25/M40 family metallo-hydrolase n=1 Tax=unclassified Corynebacterium TaxID=2624378 RepID=UPI00211CF5E3|nr:MULTISPECIES: M20/M25/M40 family metallo-hydrolase [unclassified Corynebacterium]MCQ9371712.1 M20/M25/M40 family metallo-hydrolase [Corynebacterium sp. 35RC1]MCQ9353521.1 M20/M25/M40 family metallo-hydrolase [Corynebacterium sp. 209RC1]MCQ9355744.1 M20/M25/M40 family metallo-hydrolase [Corynebacterium sp. 1222RC1]MCQ9357166.1 M20/M25/M40 family metallo-hydrolase [Corynebacterium sp. 122RC1]MCQ9359341.1 M20/M25/M40 family metallo-hydrolase [Corynebacterium sp. 142RC1]